LTQEHTRRHVRSTWIPELTHPWQPMGKESVPGIHSRARSKFESILAEHQPEPLSESARAELRVILDAAARELSS
jgi:trimethylamine:corrinoid methyltransferase-like protein